MCCEEEPRDLPPAIAAMLGHYRRKAGSASGWGMDAWFSSSHHRAAEMVDPRELNAALQRDWADIDPFVPEVLGRPDRLESSLRNALDGEPPDGCAIVQVDGGAPRVVLGLPRPAAVGGVVEASVLIDSQASDTVEVQYGDLRLLVPPRGARVLTVAAPPHGATLLVGGQPVELQGVVERRSAGLLTLAAPMVCRWSVVDDQGWHYFPENGLEKVDFHGRPYFHTREVELQVPAGSYVVTVGRGMEYESVSHAVQVAAGASVEVTDEPRRRYDPARNGWFGGDLHVHLNYGGRLVADPGDAAAMQRGEGLHFMNLVAGNAATSLVWDRELLETWLDQDLPWSTKAGGDPSSAVLGRAGVEYRNDLLGHFHVTGLHRLTGHYHSGHALSDRDEDWPPNAAAAADYRAAGGATGYAHPIFFSDSVSATGPIHEVIPDSDETVIDRVFDRTRPRNFEALELVADAALGLVDSVDVVSNADPWATGEVYRRLLGCGLRLACTAGSDAMLSMRRYNELSNPPGSVRVYARIAGDLSAEAFTEAVKGGRTIATNGPWLELRVDGLEPGEVLELPVGRTVRGTATVVGAEAQVLEVLCAAGVVVSRQLTGGEEVTVEFELDVHQPTYIVAVARGTTHANVPYRRVYAHTSPVHIHVGGEPVARAEDARWCIEWLDRFEQRVLTHGVFHRADHRDDLLDVSRRARGFYEGVVARDVRRQAAALPTD